MRRKERRFDAEGLLAFRKAEGRLFVYQKGTYVRVNQHMNGIVTATTILVRM